MPHIFSHTWLESQFHAAAVRMRGASALAESAERTRRDGVAAAGLAPECTVRYVGARGTMQVRPVEVCSVVAAPKEPKVAWKPQLRKAAVGAAYEWTGHSGAGPLARPVGAFPMVAAKE